MASKPTASFDELIHNRYGGGGRGEGRFALNVDDLLSSYYGTGAAKRKRRNRSAVMLSVSADNGETLRQPHCRCGNGAVSASAFSTATEEYVVRGFVREPPATPAPAREGQPAPEERQPGPERTAPLPSVSPPIAEPVPAAVAPPTASAAPQAQDDDFIADMKSILSGQMVYDPNSKKAVEKSRLAAAASQAPLPPAPDARNGQAIFDRIAESMQYANAYNLGTVELENRFSEFDALAEVEARGPQAAPPAPAAVTGNGRTTTTPVVDAEDFIRDLDSIRSQQPEQPPADETAGRPATAQSIPPYSKPLFDTGEHVQTAGDSYEGRLRVGRPPGEPFSYGQIIAMADLYESVNQMMAADAGELRRIKGLIDKSTAHYTRRGPDVDTEDWEEATGGRYLKLANDNYEHFSPPLDGASLRGGRRFGDNRSAWESHHRRAIEEAQRLHLAHPNQSVFLEWPLIINAFGDHFLTDAFASGHLINKEVMVDAFKKNFLSGSSLTSEGKQFFQLVARKTFRGEVARRFSALETVDYPVCAAGWCLRWRPNIDSPNMFGELLIAAAEQEPDRIANFAVKALHDRLNKDGVQVTNDAGDGTWTLVGDAHLNEKNLRIIRKAVQQSIDNINDPSILASNLDFGAFFAKVWRHVPRPTAPAATRIAELMDEYTKPTAALADDASRLITKELKALIKTLLDEGKLKAA